MGDGIKRKGNDMAEFFDEDDGVKAKLVSAKWGVETYRGRLFGRIECSLKEELTDAETEILTDWISGQNSDGYSFINAESEDAFNEAVQRIIQNAYFTNGDAPEYGDRLLTLSTCYGSTRSSRLIIIAKEENANVWKTESADAGTDGGNSDEGLLRYDIARLREILVRPLCCWRQLPICMGYPRISPCIRRIGSSTAMPPPAQYRTEFCFKC